MILIVDDNIEWCMTMKLHINNVLPKEEIIECHRGLDAVEVYKNNKPDLVLMDIELDDIDGLKVTCKLKIEFSDARIIIVSQYDDKAFREEAKMAGAIGYITKDNLAPLKEILLSFLQREN